MSKEKVFFPGHKVEFKYTHWLNSTASTTIIKTGVLIRAVRNKSGLQQPTGFYMVKINGNKTLSKIHQSRLKNITLNNE